MPELPEVETIRRQMEDELEGAKISAIEVRFAGRLNVPAGTFEKTVVGASFKEFGRRAKLLLLHLSNPRLPAGRGWTIVAHLKMTGRFLLLGSDYVPGKHDHVIFHLSGVRGQRSGVLVFQDVRKFGYLKLIRTDELEKKIFSKEGYGPEPLDPSFNLKKFRMCLTAHPKKKLKPLLMEQSCIAGIGNIYADEACWYGRVHPTRRVETLSEKELMGVYRGAMIALRGSLKHRGSSADMYLDLYGREGTNIPYLKVYGRDGEKCRRGDGGVIKKIWINSRGAHFCPRCQK